MTPPGTDVPLPVVAGVALGGLLLLYVGFKVTKFILKVIFVLAALAVLAGAALWIFSSLGP
jgi:hypothetical protein